MTDFFSEAQAVQANNWLRNGNFARVPRQIVARNYPEPPTEPRIATAEVVPGPDISLKLSPTPIVDYLAAWSLAGSAEDVAIVDFDPIDKRTGIRLRSYDSGKLLRVTFSQNGKATISQAAEVVNHFKGMTATIGFSLYAVYGSPSVVVEVDYGVKKTTSLVHYGDRIGAYRRITHEMECPLDLTKIVVTFVIEGKRNQSIGLSGVALALGPASPFMPYCESPGDTVLPRGTIILWTGEACPAGFKKVDDAEDGFLFQIYGDPNLFSGGKEEYPSYQGGSDPYYFGYASRKPTVRSTLGDNQHFVHQQTSLVGETEDEFLSGDPDGQKRLATCDFNDDGEPPGSAPGSIGHIRDKNVIATDGDASGKANWPFDSSAVNQVEQFKRNTKQNLVLPGGVGDPNASNAAGADVWRDPHKHTFTSKDEVTLPPYRTFLFCEKI